MTLSTTQSRVSYAGNGSSTVFSFPYYFLLTTDLVVILRQDSDGTEVTQTITTHYTVSGAGNSAGGSVTMLTAPASGYTLTIYRDPTATQGLDLVENDPLPAEEVEKAFDKTTMLIQRINDLRDRSVTLTDGFAGTFDPSLPPLIEASKLLGVNAGATAFALFSPSEFAVSVSLPTTTKGDLVVHNGSVNVRKGVGADNTILVADSTDSTGVAYKSIDTLSASSTIGVFGISNYSLSVSAAASALTIALKSYAGTNPSSTDSVKIPFRSSTATTGAYVFRTVTGALSTVISSGSTAGFVASQTQDLHIYALDNAGTVELAWSGTRFDENVLQSTTAEGGAGAADSKTVLYSTTARSNVPIKYLGKATFSLATPGTWAAPSVVAPTTANTPNPKSMIYVYGSDGYGATATKIKRFTTTSVSTGSDITYVNDGTNGGKFTINTDGIYSATYCENFTTDGSFGISLNSSQLTTAIDTITDADRMVSSRTVANGKTGSVSVTLVLSAGDVLRAHTNGDTLTSTNMTSFRVTRLS